MRLVISTDTWQEKDNAAVERFEARVRDLAAGHEVVIVPPEGNLIAAMAEAEVFFPFSGRTLKPELVEAGRKLKWIHLASAGVEHAMFPALVDGDIVLTNAAGVYGIAIAEHTLAMMLALTRGFPKLIDQQRRHEWQSVEGDELFDGTALIVGLGGIGRRIARLCRGFGMKVIATRRHPETSDPDADEVYSPNELLDLLPRADWVIIATALTGETKHIIGAEQLALMKPAARIVNIARGKLIDEAALIEALRQGHIAGAALDVFETEPLPSDSPLWDMPNVIVSPHTSGASPRNLERTFDLFCENLTHYLRGEPLKNVVDKAAGY